LRVSAGKLGTNAEELEERLCVIFERASKWKVLLLLDEVDVFLEKLAERDINRNTLVYLFLHALKYYRGIMFIMANRVRKVDAAIASRIHFKIKYADLSLEQENRSAKTF
jgi:hypothetical protein